MLGSYVILTEFIGLHVVVLSVVIIIFVGIGITKWLKLVLTSNFE